MISEIFSGILCAVVFVYDTAMGLLHLGRILPPLLADITLAVAGAAYLTRLRKATGRVGALPGLDKCVAHRGASLDAPENTMAAFKYCVERGCKYIEFDVQSTKDGVVLVWHDAQIGGKTIATHTWSQLKDTPIGNGHPLEEKFGTVYPCTLSEAAEYLLENQVHMLIDLKGWNTTTFSAVAGLFAANPSMYETCLVTSLNPLALYKVRRIDPKIVGSLAYHPRTFSAYNFSATRPIQYRFENSPLKHCFSRILDSLYAFLWWSGLIHTWVGCSVVLLHKDITSPWVVAKWRQRGMEVGVWTVNQPSEKRLVERVLCVPHFTDTLLGVNNTPNGRASLTSPS